MNNAWRLDGPIRAGRVEGGGPLPNCCDASENRRLLTFGARRFRVNNQTVWYAALDGDVPWRTHALLEQPGVQLLVALYSQPWGKEALPHEPDLVLDQSLLPN